MNDVPPALWRRSSRSGQEGGQCVELADRFAAIAVRDSKNPDEPMLSFSRTELKGLLDQVKAGSLDL